MLVEAHEADRLKFFGNHASLADRATFSAFLAPLKEVEWVVYAKELFAGPEPVLRYMARYTHRVAISNRRLVAADDGGVAFRWKDYRLDRPEWTATAAITPVRKSSEIPISIASARASAYDLRTARGRALPRARSFGQHAHVDSEHNSR
jgi:hypothetical protein